MKKEILQSTKYTFIVLILLLALPSISFAFQIPDTGQTNCYDENDNLLDPCPEPGEPFYGQDAQYQGSARSYTKLAEYGVELIDTATTDNGWIMTRDNVTGLIWEVKTNDNGIHDTDNTYTWCDTNPLTNGGEQGTCDEGTDTEDFIAELNNANYGGYNDWRMPLIRELATLINFSYFPYPERKIDTDYFPNIQIRDMFWYWSSNTASDNNSIAWMVNFATALDGRTSKSLSRYVLAVRGSLMQETPDRFQDNGDGTITDKDTGLMWQQTTKQNLPSWEEALSYAENLTLAGYGDWRLPDINELQSLIDYSVHTPSINTDFFPDTLGSSINHLYKSSTNRIGEAYEMCVNFQHGYIAYKQNTNYDCKYVRAVRGGQSYPLAILIISTIQPNIGDSNGGTNVSMTGFNFGDIQGNGKVTFEDLEATIVSWSDTEIVLTTPAHAAGAVDVNLTTNDNKSITFSIEFIYYSDADGDGVIDDIDQCPDTPQLTVVYSDGCKAQNLYNFDVNEDGQIGLEEAIRALQITSGQRPQP